MKNSSKYADVFCDPTFKYLFGENGKNSLISLLSTFLEIPDIEDITFLSPRLYGHLNRHGIVNLADIENTTKDQWIRKVGFGRKSWEELRNLMKLYALKFKEE